MNKSSPQSLEILYPGRLSLQIVLLVAVGSRHKTEIWVCQRLEGNRREHQELPDMANHPGKLISLAFSILRVGYLTIRAQCTAYLRVRWYRLCKFLHSHLRSTFRF